MRNKNDNKLLFIILFFSQSKSLNSKQNKLELVFYFVMLFKFKSLSSN